MIDTTNIPASFSISIEDSEIKDVFVSGFTPFNPALMANVVIMSSEHDSDLSALNSLDTAIQNLNDILIEINPGLILKTSRRYNPLYIPSTRSAYENALEQMNHNGSEYEVIRGISKEGDTEIQDTFTFVGKTVTLGNHEYHARVSYEPFQLPSSDEVHELYTLSEQSSFTH